jgi:hypothetical protein
MIAVLIASNNGIAIFIFLEFALFFFVRHRSSKYGSIDVETTISTKSMIKEDDKSD